MNEHVRAADNMSQNVGVFYDLPNEQYHAGPGVSKSDLDMIHKSPALWKYLRDNPGDPSAAMTFGSAFHTLILEPERFDAEYAEVPQVDRRTKAGKEAFAAIEASGKTVLSAENWAALHGMRDSVLSNPIAAALIKDSIHEVSMYANVDETLCKCRPDIWCEKRLIIADLKSTQDASPREFTRSIANFRYYVQAAWYMEITARTIGTAPREFVFIAVEKKPPYLVGIYTLDADAKMIGWSEAREDLAKYAECVRTGEWPGYSRGVVPLQLPRWI